MKIRKNKYLWVVRTLKDTVEICRSIKCPEPFNKDYKKGFNASINIFTNASILTKLLNLKKGIPVKVQLTKISTLSKYHQKKKKLV